MIGVNAKKPSATCTNKFKFGLFVMLLYMIPALTENKKNKPFMVVIRAPKNTKGLYIGSNTGYNRKGTFRKNEYEYLFPREMPFMVLEKDESHIVLEAVVGQAR